MIENIDEVGDQKKQKMAKLETGGGGLREQGSHYFFKESL